MATKFTNASGEIKLINHGIVVGIPTKRAIARPTVIKKENDDGDNANRS